MARALKLEVFDLFASPVGQHDPQVSLPGEEQKLQAFEKGYAAGWDDALDAQSANNKRICSELDQSLQDLSFTYHEARSQVLNDLKPLLTELTDTFLPSLSRETFSQLICDRALAISQDMPQSRIALHLRPEDVPLVEGLLEGQSPHLELEITSDETLEPGQASLIFDDAEEEIDLNGAFRELRAAMDNFYQPNRKAE